MRFTSQILLSENNNIEAENTFFDQVFRSGINGSKCFSFPVKYTKFQRILTRIR